MKSNSEAGVTLVEILIAVSLLSLLSVGMLVAMRLGFNTMDKTDKRLVANRRVANSRQIIENEIDGFVWSYAWFHPQPEQTSPLQFLQTEAQTMRFVTTYSIDDGWRGRPRIAAMQVIPGDKNEGVRLIVNETPYTGPEQAGQQIQGVENDPLRGFVIHYAPVEAGTQSFVLADRLAYCRFSYLEKRYTQPFQVWRSDWAQPQVLPMAVRIEMAPLDARPNDLRIGAVTVPFHVNRIPGTTYADFTPPTVQ
ncbi:MAG: prepilin-type N-terminal cleavage/methylation domain-containing protein [Acidobacteriota bacterium]|nr:prepilin-type N-terminal cleavage/methylation domain-containing protein [Acidobacteriota bacterium]